MKNEARKKVPTLFIQTKHRYAIISSPNIHWSYFTRKCSKRANLTLEGNEENYGKLLSLSTANICRINVFAVYNLFSTLAKPVLFHLSWETTGAWIIHEGAAYLSCSLAHWGQVYTLKCNEVKLETEQTLLHIGSWNFMCLSKFMSYLNMPWGIG